MNVHSLASLAALGFVATLVTACSGASKTEEVVDDPTATESGSVKAPVTPGKSVTPPSSNDGKSDPAPGTDDKKDSKPPTSDPKEDPTTPVPGQDGVNRSSVNEHCCYGNQYFKCPSATACFGGFDLEACLSGCSPFDPCFDQCFDKEASAPAPKGCQAMTAPKGVDCSTGTFQL